MSTFRGIVLEFPEIRIDFFRPIFGHRAPRACFLSHVHSDHLAGLENQTFHGNFLYCSPATREILLRLEKYPARMDFHRGISQAHKATYKHLKDRLKTIPLETPTCIELEPGNEIQVTLFDANHCTGAVMFLIEGNDKAILYTGDIRSEPWFVNNLIRNPFLIQYTSGMKKLDCIYLDTSNTQPIPFPTKADGLKELLQKVSKYPADTVFHLAAWTFGYEEVWMALSRTLKSQIHVDGYKLGLYESLRGNSKDPKGSSEDKHLSGPFLSHEGPVLAGYKCGNTPQAGYLTSDQNVRIHSCENGMHCDRVNEKTVWIRPIITRTQHGEMAEIGVGGGGGDLTRRPELDLDSDYKIDEFLELFVNTEDLVLMEIERMLRDNLRSGRTALSFDEIELDQTDFSLAKLAELLARSVAQKRSASVSEGLRDKVQTEALPKVITFPYSRHSSYAELCHLVKVFNPKDVYPCTVDETNWDEDISMKELFGQECSATQFRHDDEMRELHTERYVAYTTQQTHTTATSESSQMLPPSSPVERMAQTLKTKSVILRRNSQGRLRQFDADGNEVSFAVNLKDGTAEDRPMIIPSTPPCEILAKSPGSESQNLRRKAINDGMRDVKRIRLQHDGHDCSPLVASSSNPPTTLGRREHNLPPLLSSSEGVHTPGSDADTPATHAGPAPAIAHPFLSISIPRREENRSNNDPFELKWENGDYDCANSNFVDNVDNIVRCKECCHEVWAVWMTRTGFCTGCSSNEDVNPYYEIIDPEAGPRPEIEPGPYAQILIADLGRDRSNIVGDYIDEEYDTLDENPDYRSEYDTEDSFIDDASTDGFEHGDEDVSPSDGEKDYKQIYKDLQTTHHHLIADYCELAERHDDVMKDLMGSQYDSDELNDSDTGNMDEEGALMVTVSNPDPVVAELVLSQAQEQSQESEISADRLRDRAKAFEAADDGQGWQNISLISTGDNHTHEEVEL